MAAIQDIATSARYCIQALAGAKGSPVPVGWDGQVPHGYSLRADLRAPGTLDLRPTVRSMHFFFDPAVELLQCGVYVRRADVLRVGPGLEQLPTAWLFAQKATLVRDARIRLSSGLLDPATLSLVDEDHTTAVRTTYASFRAMWQDSTRRR